MWLWFLLLLALSSITYILVKRSAAKITQTPIWLLWLVLMAPAFVWTAWFLVYGEGKPLPPLLFVGPFILSPLVYWWLIQRGQQAPAVKEAPSPPPPASVEEVPKGEREGAALRPITANEEKSLRNCFPWGIYFLQHLDYHPQAILCRGKLRTSPERAYQTVKDNVEGNFGDRFLVLFQEGFQEPFFALVPNPWAKSPPSQPADREPLTRPLLALGLLLLTFLTTTLAGLEMSGLELKQLQAEPSLLLRGLPYSLGTIAFLGCHEFSHYLMAARYRIRATLPCFIPVPFFLGTFGAYIQMRSPVPHRKALFDVAVAGPLGGFLVTVLLLWWGLSRSEVVPLAEESSFLTFSAIDPRFSFLFAVLGKFALGTALVPGTAIHLHPLAIAGYVGLIFTALNLMPVGQLDGGHIVHAMFGQRTAMAIGQVARILMLVLAMVRSEFLLWAVILFLMPVADQPALNDVTELDDGRDILGLLSLALLIVILLPLPGAVSQWLSL